MVSYSGGGGGGGGWMDGWAGFHTGGGEEPLDSPRGSLPQGCGGKWDVRKMASILFCLCRILYLSLRADIPVLAEIFSSLTTLKLIRVLTLSNSKIQLCMHACEYPVP